MRQSRLHHFFPPLLLDELKPPINPLKKLPTAFMKVPTWLAKLVDDLFAASRA